MKDKIKAELMTRDPLHAQGHICIDLTDPLTGKTVSRVEGENHVFPIGIWGSTGLPPYYAWYSKIDKAYMVLTDSTKDIDADFPFLLGNPTGFGIPSTAGNGIFRGAYNAANQVIGASTLMGLRWKFQYDFTTAQANGSIGTIGLTNQYVIGANETIRSFKSKIISLPANDGVTVGMWNYAARYPKDDKIYKTNPCTGENSAISISALYPVASNLISCISFAYDAINDKYGLLWYSPNNSSSSRLTFCPDNTFSSVSETYIVSNIYSELTYSTPPFLIYGDYLFGISGRKVIVFDYKANALVNTQTFTGINAGDGMQLNNFSAQGFFVKSPYLFVGLFNNSSSACSYYIYDMSLRQFVGMGAAPVYSGSIPSLDYFYQDVCIPTFSSVNLSPQRHANCAIAAKKLDTPVVKTDANGMTVTYELEVFY